MERAGGSGVRRNLQSESRCCVTVVGLFDRLLSRKAFHIVPFDKRFIVINIIITFCILYLIYRHLNLNQVNFIDYSHNTRNF